MSLIESLLQGRDNTYSSKIRGELARAQRRKQEDYIWKARIPVSAITSWDICPKEILLHQKKPKYFKTKTLEKMDLGNVIHLAYQKAAMNTPNLKWIQPYNLPEDQRERLKEVWPEIPVVYRDPDTGEYVISGIADDVENYCNKPAVIDIKSVNDDPAKFKNYFEKTYPVAKHIIQVKIYKILMNWDKYYDPFQVDWAKLLYVNTRMEKGEDGYERELYFRESAEEEEKLHLICKESIRQIRGKYEEECKYRYCIKHSP